MRISFIRFTEMSVTAQSVEDQPAISNEFLLERERDAKFNEWLQKKSLRDKSLEVSAIII